MPSPFPGMDPYLEHPALWPDVHNSLIAGLRDELGPKLRPEYVVCLEERLYLAEPDALLVGVPDVTLSAERRARDLRAPAEEPATEAHAVAVEVPVPAQVRETYLEVRVAPHGEVVTVIEVLSHANKTRGRGRRLYERKRRRVLASEVHLVEVDLLRAGEPMAVHGADGAGDYSILVSRGDRRPRAALYPFSVREAIPRFRLPLLPAAEEPLVDLRTVLDRVYGPASYDVRAGYAGEPVPPLREQDRAWSAALVSAAGLRS